MYVMEPADERNNDHSHVAHKMKHKPMKFEDNNGIAYIQKLYYTHVVTYMVLSIYICCTSVSVVIYYLAVCIICVTIRVKISLRSLHFQICHFSAL